MGISTGRLRFTPAHPEDAERILEAIDPSTLTNFSFFAKPVGLEDERRYLERMDRSTHDHLYLIEEITRSEPEERRLIGSIGLHELDDVLCATRLGCIIYRKADRGRGYGGEAIRLMLDIAFTRLHLHKVYIQFFASRGAHEIVHWQKKGFTVEGTLREEYRLGDDWKDMIRMSMLDREYEAKYGPKS
jgi:RimJ/RimL family protein N-acetyltransferase